MKNVNWMLFFVIALAIVSTVLVVVAIFSHDEPDVMHVRWNGNQVSEYFDTQEEGTEPLVWTVGMPLRVKVDGRAPLWRLQALDSAITSFNFQVGCPIFLRVEEGEAEVLIDLEAALVVGRQTGHAGTTRHFLLEDGRMRAKVEVYGVSDSAMAMNVIEHELGHAVGLAHDDFVMSLMHPNAASNSEFSRITDHDRKTLRNLYCR